METSIWKEAKNKMRNWRECKRTQDSKQQKKTLREAIKIQISKRRTRRVSNVMESPWSGTGSSGSKINVMLPGTSRVYVHRDVHGPSVV